MKRIVILSILAVLPLSACDQPLNSREKGLLVGTGLGAGTGAIIGSATGHAGVGTAIGAGLGALAGGIIGNESHSQDQRQAEQDERLRRQEEELRRQRREIDELRREGGRDTPSRTYDSNSNSGSTTGSGYSY